jgi:hypothetical protein
MTAKKNNMNGTALMEGRSWSCSKEAKTGAPTAAV